MTAYAGSGNGDDSTPGTERLRSEDLRGAARFLEAVGLDEIEEFSRLSFIPVAGGVKDFPRPSPEDRAALEGVQLLRLRLQDGVAALHALASALEADPDRTVSSSALIPLQPYLDAYRKVAPDERPPYLTRGPNDGVDEDEFAAVDVEEDGRSPEAGDAEQL